jgi:hypothetical protein
MRLSEFLAQPDVQRAKITVIGILKTGISAYKVLAIEGETLVPIPEIFHLVPDEPDPDLDEAEIASVRRRFRLDKPGFRTRS